MSAGSPLFNLRLAPEERDALERAAAAARIPLGTFIKAAALAAAATALNERPVPVRRRGPVPRKDLRRAG